MPLKALVVDDSKVMRMMVMSGLRKTGLAEFEFVEAEDGVQALEKLKEPGVGIAFVDWNMPNMTGLDFVKEVRKQPEFKTLPLVMVTSEKTMGKMEQALNEAGADAYICKPFTPEEMQQKLDKIIARATAATSGGGFLGRLFT